METNSPENDKPKTEDIAVSMPEPETQPDGVYETEAGGHRILTTMKDGKRNGLMQAFDGKLLIMDLYYEKDILEGPFNIYYPNAKIQSRGKYVNDVLEGEFLVFYPKGDLQMKMHYVHGKQTGKTIVYDEQGAVIQESLYADGILNGETVTYHDGDVLNRQFYVKGVEEKNPLLQNVA